jgi:hypothetical protein
MYNPALLSAATALVWLKYLENGAARQGRDDYSAAAYDFAWMWEELGLTGRRQ